MQTLEGRGLELLMPQDTETYYATVGGSPWTLDLIFASATMASRLLLCEARRDWSQNSDHIAVLSVFAVAVNEAQPVQRFKMKGCDGAKLAAAARRKWEEVMPTLPPIEHDAESWATALLNATEAALAETVPVARPSPHSKAWFGKRLGWQHQAVNRLRREWQEERDPAERDVRRQAFRRMSNAFTRSIRSAKRQSAREALALPGDDLFRIAKASQRSNAATHVAALKSAAGEATTAEAKEEVLRAKFFPEEGALEPAPPSSDGGEATATPWTWRPITEGEVRRRINDSKKDTAAGVDRIPWSAHRHLAQHWSMYCTLLAYIFENLIQQGCHPRVYKVARTVVLRKPGKVAYDVAGAYRPITLLPTTGKLLEAIIAARVIGEAERRRGVLAREHYGGRPYRSSEDATLQMQQFIRDGHATKRHLALMAVDVSGAYNAVRREPLLRDLQRAGWPEQLVGWARSFTEERVTHLQVGDYAGPSFNSSVGLPQGSPISQLLWLTYSHDLVNVTSESREAKVLSIGWVDDWTVVAAANTEDALNRCLAEVAAKAETWRATHGAAFDAEKSALVALTRIGTNGPTLDPLTMGSHVIQRAEHAKVLGVIFEARGQFKRQAAERAAKASSATSALLSMGSRTWGWSLANARRLYLAGVVPRMLHGCQTWMPTRSERGRGRVGFLRQFEQIQRVAAISITGAFRTTSTDSLNHEANLLPVADLFDVAHARAFLRLRTVPQTHPLSHDVDKWLRRTRKRYTPPLQALAQACPIVAEHHFQRRPCPRASDWEPPAVRVPPSKELAVAMHSLVQAGRYGDLYNLYSDGSRSDDGRVGAAAVWRRHGEWRSQMRGMPHVATIMCVEVAGIELAANMLAQSAAPLQRAIIWCDSQAALRAIASPKTSDANVRRVQDLLVELRRDGWEVRLQWLPGHLGVAGNEKADEMAKRATHLEAPAASDEVRPSAALRAVKVAAKLSAERRFRQGKGAGLKEVITCPDPDRNVKRHAGLSRGQTSLLTQMRTGHCGVNAYLYQRTIESSPRCECGNIRETRRHLLMECPRFAKQRRTLVAAVGRGAMSMRALLDSRDGKVTRAALKLIGARFPKYGV